MQDAAPPARVEIAVVGGGFSGIGMAVRLRRMGIEDFVVLDRGPEPGGTWRDNTYPGAACDIPSDLYSFSFALNPGWTRTYSPQAEIQEYLRRCTDAFGVAGHFRFGQEVRSASWDAGAGRWHLDTGGGRVSARIVIWATGPLSEPRVPDIPGLATFGGKVFHSAAWDHHHDLRGRRVAVVGTGASAIQFVPRIQPLVAELHLYQRTPPWIIPRHDRDIPARRQRLFRRHPLAQRLVRGAHYWRLELLAGPVVLGRSRRKSRAMERYAAAHLAAQVPDTELRDLLRPDYRIGCKRILISDDYYPALTRPNVEVVPAAVREVRPGAVVDARGEVRRVDTLILGTGFQAAEPSFAAAITGVGGRTLARAWEEGAQAYLGSTVPGFPNLFFLIGPNTTLGHNSMVYMIESHVAYVAGAVAFLRRPGVGQVEVRPEVAARFAARLAARMAGTTWVTGGCTSWYLDHRGRNTTLWPEATYRFRQLTRHFHPADYAVTPAVAM